MRALNSILFYVGTRHVLSTVAETSMNALYLKRSLGDPEGDVNQACAEFDDDVPNSSGWKHSDCVTVWNGWVPPAGKRYPTSSSPHEIFTEMSTELRERGSPCLVDSIKYPAGAGSTAIQHLETWIFAEEMGCDWILPGSGSKDGTTNGSSLYCHLMVSRDTMHLLKDNNEWENGDDRLSRCNAINWPQFFHYNAHAVMKTFDGKMKTVEVSKNEYLDPIQHAVDEYQSQTAEDKLPWDRLCLHLGSRSANTLFQLPGSWDSFKRKTVRDVLRKYREGFFEFPRPWNGGPFQSYILLLELALPQCKIGISRKNIVRTATLFLILVYLDESSPRWEEAILSQEATIDIGLEKTRSRELVLDGLKLRLPPSLVRRKLGVFRPGFVGMRGQCLYDYDTKPAAVTAPSPPLKTPSVSTKSLDVQDGLSSSCLFNNEPTCMYSSSSQELDIAIHIRLGDRITVQDGFESSYEGYIKAFMDTVAAAVIRRGLGTPMFHVFSETSLPCPSVENGTFAEFPTWPVDPYQIEPCLNPITPEDCPEKQAGASSCSPKQSGIFRVLGKPLYLHIGYNVQNELTCMAKADGILIGCSTFGQTAGVLNRGLKFVSFQCGGKNTPGHNNMVPLLSIAENGNLWVPVKGSWRDPSILSESIFEAALDEHLKNKGVNFVGG